MSKQERKYLVYVKSMNQFVEVDKDFYYNYYREIWAHIKRCQRLGECVCPQSKICYCNVDCLECKYHRFINLSLDESIGNGDSTVGDSLVSKSFEEKYDDFSSLLWSTVENFSYEEKIILNGLEKKTSNSELKEILGYRNSDSAFCRYKKRRITSIKNKMQRFC